MLMRNHKTSLATDAESAVPGVVASLPQIRVFVISHRVAALKWPAREQRERE